MFLVCIYLFSILHNATLVSNSLSLSNYAEVSVPRVQVNSKDNNNYNRLRFLNKKLNDVKTRFKRDLNKPHDQNEDVYTELQQKTFFVDELAVKQIFQLGPYEYKSVSYASTFHYLLQLVLPGLSNLTLEEILKPDVLMHAEILRLKEMMLLKAKLAQLEFSLKTLKENIQYNQSEIDSLPIELTETYVQNLKKLKHDYSEMMKAAVILKNKFEGLNTIQNTCI